MGKYAIFIVSALIFSLLTYSSALRNAIFLSNTRTIKSISINQAQNIAQSAAMIAINDIRNDEDSPFNTEESETYAYPSANGFQYWSNIEGSYNITSTNQGDTLLVLQSTGKFEETTYRVTVGLIKGSSGSFTWPPVAQAVHADKSISLSGSASIQGSASINGIEVGAVVFNGNPAITGILYIGPGGNPDEVVDIPDWHEGPLGGIYNLEEELEYELPDYPAFPEGLPVGSSFINKKWNDETNLPVSQYEGKFIPIIEVGANRSMTIEVGDQNRNLYVGDFDIKNGHVNLVGTGKLEIYIKDDITLGAGSSVNCNAEYYVSDCTGDTGQLLTFYGGSSRVSFAGGTYFNGNLFVEKADVKFSGGNHFQGNLISGGTDVEITGGAGAVSAFYAPNAAVKFSGGGTLSGYVVSDTFTATGGTWVYDSELDTELPDLGGGEGETTYTISYWN